MNRQAKARVISKQQVAVKHSKPHKMQKQEKIILDNASSQNSTNMIGPEEEDDEVSPTPRPLKKTMTA